MVEFDLTHLDAVLATCRSGAVKAGQAFSRALTAPLEVVAGDAAKLACEAAAGQFEGSGLVIAFNIGQRAAVLVVPDSSGMLPPWYARPKTAEANKLTTLANELSLALLPPELTPGDTRAEAVADLPTALKRGLGGGEAALVRLTLRGLGNTTADMALIWPILDPSQLFESSGNIGTSAADSARSPLDVLPPYSRSLLRIKVPVAVKLASKRQPLERIVEIVPGAILQFAKSCDETLDLEVAELPVAQGECVKVGDKFGLRITSLKLPCERFIPVRP